MKSSDEIISIRKRAAWVAFGNLTLGLLAMLQSLREGSTAWALFIWLIALQGVAIGLLSGPAWSDHLLDRTPPHRRGTAAAGCAWSVLTFWGPIVAAFLFGLIMAKTLPDAARPQSSLDGSGGTCLFQAWVIAFNAFGCTWLIVWLDSQNAIRQAALKPSNETPGVGN
jgi:MFS family permease